jgi:hypothetical protein
MVSASTDNNFTVGTHSLKTLSGAGFIRDLVKSKTGNEYLIIAKRRFTVVEPLLSGIVLGLIVATLAGLFYAAYKQFKRPNQLGG